MSTDNTNTSDFVAYHYSPSLALAACFTALFALSTALHTFQLTRTRALYLLPLTIGGLFETVGYTGRVISSTETTPNFSLPPYILQAILILIAPALFAASIYMILGYIIQATGGERHALIQAKFLTKIFVIGDVFSFLVQSTGAGLLTKKDPDAPKTGRWIIIGGLVIQLLFFGWFMVVSVVFYLRYGKESATAGTAAASSERQEAKKSVPWRLHMWALFVASGLIMVRSVFRVVEYVQGDQGYLLSHELYLYVFDAALMIAVLVVFNVIHPSRITGRLTGSVGVKHSSRVEKARGGADVEQ